MFGLKFIKSAALAVAVALAGCTFNGVESERVGVCSWSWRLPLKEVAVAMERDEVMGIHLALGPFIEPDGRHGCAESEDAFKFVKDRIASGKWVLMATMIGMVGENYSTLETIRLTGGIVPDSTWEQNKRIVTRGAQLTAELGCRYMSTHAGFLDITNRNAFEKYVERVSWMRDECKKYNVQLILESGQETAEELLMFMEKVPGVGINFDPANMILYGKGNPMAAVRVLMPWIRQVHIKDAVETTIPGTWGVEKPWGDGDVGGAAFIRELESLGFNGNYVVEREGGEDRALDIRRAIQSVRK